MNRKPSEDELDLALKETRDAVNGEAIFFIYAPDDILYQRG